MIMKTSIPIFPISEKPKFNSPWIWESGYDAVNQEKERVETDLAHIKGEIERITKENQEIQAKITQANQENFLMKRKLSEMVKPLEMASMGIWKLKFKICSLLWMKRRNGKESLLKRKNQKCGAKRHDWALDALWKPSPTKKWAKSHSSLGINCSKYFLDFLSCVHDFIEVSILSSLKRNGIALLKIAITNTKAKWP